MADATGNGGGDYQTFAGAGFGTLMVQLASGPKETPPVASSRAYLRGGLPAVYQDGDFGMRFVGALETVLDPIVAMLDALPAHFDPDHAPRDVLDLLAAWLGVELDESQTLARSGASSCARPPSSAAAAARGAGWSWRSRSRSPTSRCAWRTTAG